MPRPRKSAKLQERTGAWRKNPQRRRRDIPGRGDLPTSPPPHLRFTRDEACAWEEIVAWMPPGVGTGSDRFAVERMAKLLARSRGKKAFRSADDVQLRAYMNAFGFTAAARATLGTGGEPTKKNPFEKFRDVGARKVESDAAAAN